MVSTKWVQADNHLQNINIDESFKTAVKLVEKKQYIDAVNIFNVLADQEIPEAQFNLSLMLFNGLGAPKNFRQSLVWSWKAHLNNHESAINQVNDILEIVTPELQSAVADELIQELTEIAKNGDATAALKLGITFTELMVEPDYASAYVWLSIAQAFGIEEASPIMVNVTEQLAIEEVIVKQDEAAKLFAEITEK
ncbi:MAG: sel1 repeat family protein [Rhodobacterales bacterium]|nr:sel1 repeat family protein [Rhodobacterales bacterium]